MIPSSFQTVVVNFMLILMLYTGVLAQRQIFLTNRVMDLRKKAMEYGVAMGTHKITPLHVFCTMLNINKENHEPDQTVLSILSESSSGDKEKGFMLLTTIRSLVEDAVREIPSEYHPSPFFSPGNFSLEHPLQRCIIKRNRGRSNFFKRG